jgi:hypothetical protein
MRRRTRPFTRSDGPTVSLRRRFTAAVLAALVSLGLMASPVSAVYWYNGLIVEEYWVYAFPSSHSYVSVNVSCGSFCWRYLYRKGDITIASGRIQVYGSGTGALACKWDTVGSGSSSTLTCEYT